MRDNTEKFFYEYLVKNILQNYNLIDKNLKKREKPDFSNNVTGLEITRADPTLKFDGFVSKYKNNNIGNIKKFNKNFEKVGGRVFRISDPEIENADLKDSFHYNDNYIYIIPGYSVTYDLINKRIIDKLIKLNNTYEPKLKSYYLGIYSPIFHSEDDIEEELSMIIELQTNYNRKFEKIFIVSLNCIYEFDLLREKYNIIKNTNDILKSITVEIDKDRTNACSIPVMKD